MATKPIVNLETISTISNADSILAKEIGDGGLESPGWISKQNLFNGNIAFPMSVPNGTDFNTLSTPGYYYQNLSANVTNNTNMPVKTPFGMQVIRGYDIIQIFYAYNTNVQYIRYFSNGSWTVWTISYNSSNINSIFQIGSNSNGSYIVFPNKICIQYGEILGTTNADGYITVNFPIAFDSKPSTFVVGGVNTVGMVERGNVVSTHGDIVFRYYQTGDLIINQPNREADWIAIGVKTL